MKKYAILSFVSAAAMLLPGAPVEISFRAGAWKTNDFTVVKSPRLEYVRGFLQEKDCIVNPCPDLPDEEIFKKHGNEVYAATVWKEKIPLGRTVAARMSFDHRMAPLIVIAPELGTDASGRPEFREHWEIVLFDEGLNVWHHHFKDGKPSWHKAAFVKTPYLPKTVYDLSVKIEKTGKGHRQMTVSCGGTTLGYADMDLPDSFYAGVIGCEGRNRFYDFRVK